MIDLATLIRPGDGVWWGQGSSEPEPLVGQLFDQVDSLGPVTVFPGLTWNDRFSEELPPNLTVVSYGGLGVLHKVSRGGRLNVIPCHYSALPRLFATGRLPSDVALLQVSAPDEDGLVSLGIGVEYAADALTHTPTLIAEINQRMPRTVGGPRLPLSAFAATVETDRPLRELPDREPTAIDRAIAGYVAGLVSDGDTIQMGIGSLPSAILDALSGHTDLGIHSGMISDAVLRMIERGVITGAKKEIDPGLAITGSAAGTTALYDRLHQFPVEFRAASYTHSPLVLSQLRTLVSINSAIQVDLTGQVGSETRDGVYYGAVGGQADFSRAASLTGSLSIIALRSESHGESSITTALDRGVVTTTRTDVDAVVTEHGVARLTGCTEAERVRRIIEVASPRFREQLARSYYERMVTT